MWFRKKKDYGCWNRRKHRLEICLDSEWQPTGNQTIYAKEYFFISRKQCIDCGKIIEIPVQWVDGPLTKWESKTTEQSVKCGCENEECQCR